MRVHSMLHGDLFGGPRGQFTAYGLNPSVGSSAEAVWGYSAAYNFAIANTTLKVASSSANDTSAGTGAKTCRIYGLVDGVETTHDVTMNGQTAVTVSTAFDRIHGIEALTCGTGEKNAGNIYVFTGSSTAGVPATSTEVYAMMLTGYGRSHAAVMQIPDGKRGFLSRVYAGGGDVDNPVRVTFFKRVSGVRVALGSLTVNGGDREMCITSEAIPAGADVYAEAICLGVGTPEVTACFDVTLV